MWRSLVQEAALQESAYALTSILFEIPVVIGPLIVAALLVLGSPAAGSLMISFALAVTTMAAANHAHAMCCWFQADDDKRSNPASGVEGRSLYEQARELIEPATQLVETVRARRLHALAPQLWPVRLRTSSVCSNAVTRLTTYLTVTSGWSLLVSILTAPLSSSFGATLT